MRTFKAALAIILIAGLAVPFAQADHSWGGYHWGRTANPFVLELGDNVSQGWDEYLKTTATDWSYSSVLDTVIRPGRTKPASCSPTLGSVEVCNSRYGSTGWLGVAQIWVDYDHIMQATVKVNDTYFSTKAYNTPAWKNMVMCQEVGHVLGLDHQDEDFSNANLGTCMDYTSDPSSNQHPDQHDYDMLEEIYAHLDSVNTTFPAPISGGKGGGKPSSIGLQMDVSDVSAWGDVVKTDARSNSRLYKRALDENITLYTFVIWAK